MLVVILICTIPFLAILNLILLEIHRNRESKKANTDNANEYHNKGSSTKKESPEEREERLFWEYECYINGA